MKKLKALLFTLTACVLTFTIAGCAGNCGGETSAPSDDIELISIDVDTENAKTEYFVGEEFTSEGLVVTSVLRNNTQHTVDYDVAVDIEDVVIDSSEFNSSVPGAYTISLSYTYNQVTKNADYEVTVEKDVRLSRLVLDTTDVQTVYDMDENISTAGLKATAIDYDYKNGVALAPYEVNVSDLQINTDNFVKGQVGTYQISVSYTKNGDTASASYEVAVKKAAGLVLELDNVDYALTAEGTVVDLSAIEVFAAGANGKRGEALTEGYTFSAYFGDEPVTLTDNQFIATEAGAYNIWAKYEGYVIPGTQDVVDIDGFILVYVNDTLQSIEFNSAAAGTVTTQPVGANEMIDTWTFTATYSSGATKQLTSADVTIEGVNTATVTNAGVATITFTEPDAKGVNKTVTTTVNYTITEAAGEPVESVVVGSAEISALPASMTSETAINDFISVTASSSSTVTVDGNNKTYTDPSNSLNDRTYTHRLKLGGEGKATQRSIKMLTTGAAKIVIYCMSSSNSASRTAALYDSTFIDKTATPDAVVGATITVPGDQLYRYEFDVTEAGTYYFASQASGLNVYGIEIIYS